MTSQYRHRRTSISSAVFPNPIEPGEIAVNTANRQLAVGDAASASIGAPKPLLPIRYFDTAAQYVTNDFVVNGASLYRANKATGPGGFLAADWVMMVGTIDPQYVAKAGDVMTGALALPAAAPTAGVHATNKTYVDALVAAKSSVVTSDTPPAGVIDNTLWFETDTGLLYVRYNDGDSTQWVIACPQPDLSQFVAKAGDTMTGPLAVVSPPTAPTHAASKAYVDNIGVTKKNYIINGAMRVSQENGATAGTAGGYYPVDQFSLATAGTFGTLSAAQVASRTPSGSPNRLRGTVTAPRASPAAGDYMMIYTAVEGLRVADLMSGTASARTITIQFGVKAPAGTYSVAVQNFSGTRTYIASYVIAAGEANTDVVKSVTLTLDTTGTWSSDNTAGMYINFTLMAGATWQGTGNSWIAGAATAVSTQFNFMGTNGNTFELFDVSLTESAIPPPFQVPDYASELAVCQRYYRKLSSGFFMGAAATATDVGFAIQHPGMRAAPTIALTAALTITDIAVANFTQSSVSSVATTVGADGGRYTFSNFSGLTSMRPYMMINTGGLITLNARL